MKNIFEKSVTNEVIARIENLASDTRPQWGKMNAGQMLAHLSVTYEFVYTNKHDATKAKGFKKFMLKTFVKKFVVGDKPYSKNGRTAPQFLMTDDKVFSDEKARLINFMNKVQQEGEAAFAASDTNIAIVGDKTWVATGGKASRILFSPDKGKTWQVFDTPIVQGVETTGMYSLDFYDELNGFAIGGDYTKADDNTANKVRTNDGGKTWQLVAENQKPGYRSCVQYVPNSRAQQLVAIGFNGIDYSKDSGNTWSHLSDEGFYTLRFLNDSVAYAAGNKRISKLIFR